MLAEKQCVPCQGGAEPLSTQQVNPLLQQVPGWALAHGGTAIFRKYGFADFDAAHAFANQVAALAQAHGHHPDIAFGWGYVKLKLWTHAVRGLQENDFIMAAKINALPTGPADAC
jgi:4a-hydroxytetrahydrobiopterin dehydratase